MAPADRSIPSERQAEVQEGKQGAYRYLRVDVCKWQCPTKAKDDADTQFVQYPGTFFYYRWRNRSKAAKWDKMTDEEKEHYLKTTTDVGNKRLDFRFAT